MKQYLFNSVSMLLLLIASTASAAPERVQLAASIREFLTREYVSLDTSPLASGILYDLVAPLSKIEELDGSPTAPAIDRSRWLQVAFELKRASIVESDLPDNERFRERGREAQRSRLYPISLLHFDYQRATEAALRDSIIRYADERVTGIDFTKLETRSVFAATVLHERTYHGATARFILDPRSLYFSNAKRTILRYEVDFDDGSGYRDIEPGEEIEVHYSATGVKTIRLRARTGDDVELHAAFRFDVRSLDAPAPSDTWQLQAAIPYSGVFAEGEAYVFLSDQHSVLTHPVILAEGLDLDNSLNWDELYEIMNTENLLEDLRTFGFDAVVLNYTESRTYVQANGYLVKELIDQVNQVIGPNTTTALVGASMGGLTTRFALAHMETNNESHQIRTWISFDSPQNGANIPLGLQYWTDFFASESDAAAAARDALNMPAARQLLLAHFTSPATNMAQPDPLRAVMEADFSTIGDYPALPRKVSVINGSGTMQNSGFNPGAQIIRWEHNGIFPSIIGNVWALHNTQSQMIFDGEISILFVPISSQSVTVQPTWPWDNAPGGLSNTMQELDSVAAPYGDILALHPSHCFIPSISALDLAVSDPFFDIAGAPDLLALSPFDTLYFPAVNQDHITITPENYAWFLDEIIGELDPPQVAAALDDGSIRLRWQPVAGARSYRVYASSNSEAWPLTFAVTDLSEWTDPEPLTDARFYRVEASSEALPAR